MDKHKEYILRLVKEDCIDPAYLLKKTRIILEDYVESITDSSMMPILYNGSYGGYGLSKIFKNYYKANKSNKAEEIQFYGGYKSQNLF